MRLKLIAILTYASLLAPTCVAGVGNGFVVHRGGKLYVEGAEFRFVSWNVPNLLVIEDAFSFLGNSPWRWPNEYELRDALESVRQMGGTVARPYVISVKRDGSDMGDHVHVLGPGRFNEQAFKVLDQMLAIAREKGVRVIVPLVDNWRWHGGIEQYAAFRGKDAEEFWTDDQLFADYLTTAGYIIGRRNTVTGELYRDDPAIFGWETGNELDAPPLWTSRAAAAIKRLDPNHLVIDGRSLHGITPESLADRNIDVVTTHHYPNQGNNDARSVSRAARDAAGQKAYFVGEFGFLGVDEAQRILDVVCEEGVAGALFWSLRFHRREGGFYWHHEPMGGDLFKAFHWPGFPSGRPYREHLVMPMIRQAAYRIRGLQPPAPPIPGAPRLLPIDDAARISWQGAAGASGYDVQRAARRNGPWATIASDVSDAAVQYRPLFHDDTARVGGDYYYRIVATNADGASSPSNVVGPVTVSNVVLVDELADDSRIASVAGGAAFRSDDARKFQEDIHRLLLPEGAAVEYHTPGDVTSVRLWVFVEDPDRFPSLFGAVGGGDEFELLPAESRVGSQASGDYGYRTPVLVECDGVPAGVTRLRIVAQDASVQLSRVEIRRRPAALSASAPPPGTSAPER